MLADANRRLQLGLQHRQRGAELVAGVGHEPALALKRLLQAGEHLVQRLAETADLVLRGRSGSRSPPRPKETRVARWRIASTGARPAIASQ